jgi:hypothetical protein
MRRSNVDHGNTSRILDFYKSYIKNISCKSIKSCQTSRKKQRQWP